MLRHLKSQYERATDYGRSEQDLVYHTGRHTFTSLITLEGGVPLETISQMLGHSDLRIRQIYAHVTQGKLFEEMDKLIEAIKDLKLEL